MNQQFHFSSHCIVLPIPNIDTDQIIPARYLKSITKEGLGKFLFANWRYQEDGTIDPRFALNQSNPDQSKILIAEDNFGCGSSREHAVWALRDWGFVAVISTSFADIFKNNALKNGLLPIRVERSTLNDLFQQKAQQGILYLTISLSEQSINYNSHCVYFDIDAFAKYKLLNNIDELDYLISNEDKIKDYELKRML